MKKGIFCKMMALAALMLGAAACDKTPANGDLDGFWQLVESGKEQPRPRKADKVFWAVQLDLVSVRSASELAPGTKEALFRFRHGAGRLELTQGYAHYRDRDDRLDAPGEGLRQAGVGTLPAVYRVHLLTGERMILVSDDDSLVFRKY